MRPFRALALGLLAALLLQTAAFAYRVVGLSNFAPALTYTPGQFSDVAQDAWYAKNVQSVYEYGLMNGMGNGVFLPGGAITLAESVTLLSRIHSIYEGDALSAGESGEGDAWYSAYVRYALEHDLMDDYRDYDVPATRAQFAQILSKSLPALEFEEINWVDDGAIPDVPTDVPYADGAYLLYRAGVLTGSDAAGTFRPYSTITRAEAAAIVTRIIDPALRQSVELLGEY